MDFTVGTRFGSYKEFGEALKKYEISLSTNFVRQTTTKLTTSATITANVVEIFAVKRAYFKCKFGGAYQTTAVQRRNTKTFKQGCSARFGVNLRKINGVYALEISYNYNEHNHAYNDDLFGSLPNQRREALAVSNQFLHRVANVKADKKLLQFEVSKNNAAKYKVKRRDIYNFNAKNTRFVGVNDLEKVVNELCSIDGATVKILHNVQNELQGIFFQDSRMEKYFDVYPEILMFDATYSLNDRHMPLVILLVVDGNGESQIVGLFIVVAENNEILSEMFRQFKQNNKNWVKVEVIITDKAMVNLNIARTDFPNAVHHLCIFHVQQIFCREIQTRKRGITALQRTQCLRILCSMIYADSEAEYNRLYVELLGMECVGELFHGITVIV